MSDNKPKSFGKSLFFGDLPEDLVFPYPRPSAAEQEQVRRLISSFRDFARSTIDSRRIDTEARLPQEVLAGLRSLGLFGLIIPRSYGGLGLSHTASCRIFEEIASVDLSVALTLEAHSSLCARSLLLFGTEAQRQRYLPDLASGARIGAFCLTEPQSGSDPASIRTRADQPQREDRQDRIAADTGPDRDPHREGDRFVLRGSKLWVTNGGIADLFVLFAQTEVQREGNKADRITGFVVSGGPHSGVRRGAEEHKLGVRGSSTTALYLDEVQVEKEDVLGAVGGGFRVAMETLTNGRLTLSAGCVGMSKEVLRLSLLHATSRRQFGRLISSFGMIKDKIASMQLSIYAAESMVFLTTGLMDRAQRGIDYSLESACCKVFASETLEQVMGQALQIAAGCGFTADYPYERLLRDSRISSIFEGTSEILRCYIALTGMQGPGEQLAKLEDAIKYPLRGYGLVMDTLFDRMKAAAYGSATLSRHHNRLKREAVNIEDGVEALAKGIERVLRRHGKQISEMQYVQRRVADVVIDLYAMVSCVSRASAALSQQEVRRAAGEGTEAAGEIDDAERELRLCRAFCGKAHERVRLALERFNENDDELMKSIADDAYEGRSYPLDAVLE